MSPREGTNLEGDPGRGEEEGEEEEEEHLAADGRRGRPSAGAGAGAGGGGGGGLGAGKVSPASPKVGEKEAANLDEARILKGWGFGGGGWKLG